MNEPQQRRSTYDDVIAAPPHMVAELIYGSLVLTPPAKPFDAIELELGDLWP